MKLLKNSITVPVIMKIKTSQVAALKMIRELEELSNCLKFGAKEASNDEKKYWYWQYCITGKDVHIITNFEDQIKKIVSKIDLEKC